MRYLRLILLALVCLASMSAIPVAYAQRSNSGNGVEQAIRSVERQTGGRVLSAEKRVINGQVKYRLKVLTPSGHVRIIHVDAK